MNAKEQARALVRNIAHPVIVECGAHFGYDTRALLGEARGAGYYVFEPDPRNIAVLKASDLIDRIQVIEAAVADCDGTAVLYLSSGCPQEPTSADTSRDWSYSSSIRRPTGHLELHPWCHFESTTVVAKRSLDSFAAEYGLSHIDLIWADVQGAERDMVCGASQVLRRTRYLLMEHCDRELYDGQGVIDEVMRLLPGVWSTLARDGQFILLANEAIVPAVSTRLLIGALTGWQHEDRRRRCRQTWMRDLQRVKRADAVFLLGADTLVSAPVRLDDLLMLPCPDAYASLPQRTRWFCRWALERSDWDYLFKCDDDTYVCAERLLSFDVQGRNYVGSEWTPGVGYASGGAGYFLSRTAAEVVAETVTQAEGAEDALVGEALRHAGIELTISKALIGFGNTDLRPKADNDVVTTHGVSGSMFWQSHMETGQSWRFRIVIPTSNSYATTILPLTLQLLDRYWPDHPQVDVIHYEAVPPERDRTVRLYIGQQPESPWTDALARYLELYNSDLFVLFMLDDYGVCAPVNTEALRTIQQQMLLNPTIGNVHLSWQPTGPKEQSGHLMHLPRWDYSVNTQAAIWRRDLLLQIAQRHRWASIEDFELAGSRWFNEHRFGVDLHCQAAIPDPPQPSGFVDETDKTNWVLPYNNLMHRGAPDLRHVSFLANHGLHLTV